MLIVGSARSGKTELARTIVASLIAANDPSAVNIICVEPSDGSSFAAFQGVDHVAGSVQMFDEHGGVRLLRAVQSEITRRARVLADNHAVSLADYQPADRQSPDRHSPDRHDAFRNDSGRTTDTRVPTICTRFLASSSWSTTPTTL